MDQTFGPPGCRLVKAVADIRCKISDEQLAREMLARFTTAPLATLLRFVLFPQRKENGCWLWMGGCDSEGYGHFWFNNQHFRPYRLTWSWANNASFPEDLVPDHRCRTPQCVNPDHIEPVARGTNVLRGVSIVAQNAKKTHCPQGHPYNEENTYRWKGRERQCKLCMRETGRRYGMKVRRARGLRFGSKRADSKLTEAQVSRIKARIVKGDNKPRIAKDYAVTSGVVYSIAHDKTWKHVPWP